MGISGFRNLFRKKNFRPVASRNIPKKIDSLFVDANGVFHRSIDEAYGSTPEEQKKLSQKYTKKGLKARYLDIVVKKLDEVLKKVNPSINFVIAVDGIANAGKINQQKYRRFNSEIKNPLFDGRSITPGTQIMFEIDDAIQKWLKSKKDLPPVTIYSSHLEPGEGEHKIFSFIREKNVDDDGGANIIFGGDGDLAILSSMARLNNIYFWIDDMKNDRDNFIWSIDKFKDVIYQELKFEKSEKHRVINDFCLLIMFVGNDFLPEFPNLPSTVDALTRVLFPIYRKHSRYIIGPDGKINWKSLLGIFERLQSFKRDGLDLHGLVLFDPTLKLKFPTPELRDSVTLKDFSGRIVDEEYNVSRHKVFIDKKTFGQKWYLKQFRPIDDSLYQEKEFYTNKDVFDMCVSYLKTLQWVQTYYTDGYKKVDDFHFYPYRYTPLFYNISYFLKSIIEKKDLKLVSDVGPKKKFPITAVHQLLSVIPPDAVEIIPKQFRVLYPSLRTLNPSKYKILSPEGTSSDHASKPLIPPINLEFVNFVLQESSVKIPPKYETVEYYKF